MRLPLRTVSLIVSAGLIGSVALAAPASAAPDYTLTASGIQQTVLRAQMPKTLGSWRQNIYFAEKDVAPYVCWSATGTPVELPRAANAGGVGYEVSRYVTGGVMLYQYKDAASAQAALTALQGVSCPDSAKVGEDGPASAVPADQGSDFTSAERTGFVSSVTYSQQGTPVTTILRTTQRGLAVVQTTVTVAGPAAAPKRLGKASALSARWHGQVVAAYEAFGSGGSR